MARSVSAIAVTPIKGFALDGPELSGSIEPDGKVEFDYHGTLVSGHAVDGPWTAALSQLAGTRVRLVKLEDAGRVQGEPVTIVSTASLDRITAEAGAPPAPPPPPKLFPIHRRGGAPG